MHKEMVLRMLSLFLPIYIMMKPCMHRGLKNNIAKYCLIHHALVQPLFCH